MALALSITCRVHRKGAISAPAVWLYALYLLIAFAVFVAFSVFAYFAIAADTGTYLYPLLLLASFCFGFSVFFFVLFALLLLPFVLCILCCCSNRLPVSTPQALLSHLSRTPFSAQTHLTHMQGTLDRLKAKYKIEALRWFA